MENQGIDQIVQYVKLAASPVGLLAIGLFLFVLYFVVKTSWAKWAVLILFANVAALSFTPEELETGKLRAFMFPVSILRNYGRAITVSMLLLLLPSALMATRGRRQSAFLPAAFAFMCFQLIVAARLFLTEGESGKALLEALISIAQFALLGYGLNLWMQNLKDVKTCVRAIALMNTTFLVMSAQQLLVSPDLVLAGSRFMGVTSNPQAASILLSSTIPAYYYLLLDKTESKKLRIFWGLAAGLAVVFLLGTGSRTGALMLAVGTLLFFRLRVVKLLIVAPIIGVFVAVAWRYTTDVTGASSRLLDGTNTREHKWQVMWADFISHPIIGTGSSKTPENSYLATAANTGMLGLLALAVFVGLLLHAVVALTQVRNNLGALREVPNLVIAGIGALLIGAIFEAFLLGTLSFVLVVLFAYMALLAVALDAAQHRPEEVGHQPYAV
ncbi:O-antigen ligase family protein [Phycisphaeraceae bacterium D3-23]